MGKIREALGDIARITKNAEKISNYAEDYEAISEEVKKLEKTSADYEKTKNEFAKLLEKLSISVDTLNRHIDNLDGNIEGVHERLDSLDNTIATQTQSLSNISVSLQLELYQSLRSLRNRYVNRAPHGWATDAEKKVARDFYEKIHLLGQDGESESLWADIEKLPSKRTVY